MRYKVWQFLRTKKTQSGKIVMRHVTILCNKNVSTPKSPNSTVQSPTDISWSGCLDIFNQQGSFPPSTGQLMALKELKGKQGEMMKWPPVRHFCTSSLKRHQVDVRAWMLKGASAPSDLKVESSDVNLMTFQWWHTIKLHWGIIINQLMDNSRILYKILFHRIWKIILIIVTTVLLFLAKKFLIRLFHGKRTVRGEIIHHLWVKYYQKQLW